MDDEVLPNPSDSVLAILLSVDPDDACRLLTFLTVTLLVVENTLRHVLEKSLTVPASSCYEATLWNLLILLLNLSLTRQSSVLLLFFRLVVRVVGRILTYPLETRVLLRQVRFESLSRLEELHGLVNQLIPVEWLVLNNGLSHYGLWLVSVHSCRRIDQLFRCDVNSTSFYQVKHLSYLCDHAHIVTLDELTLFRFILGWITGFFKARIPTRLSLTWLLWISYDWFALRIFLILLIFSVLKATWPSSINLSCIVRQIMVVHVFAWISLVSVIIVTSRGLCIDVHIIVVLLSQLQPVQPINLFLLFSILLCDRWLIMTLFRFDFTFSRRYINYDVIVFLEFSWPKMLNR